MQTPQCHVAERRQSIRVPVRWPKPDSIAAPWRRVAGVYPWPDAQSQRARDALPEYADVEQREMVTVVVTLLAEAPLPTAMTAHGLRVESSGGKEPEAPHWIAMQCLDLSPATQDPLAQVTVER